MVKKLIKKIFQVAGADLQAYDRRKSRYHALYQKYKNFTMVPQDSFVDNLQLVSHFLSVPGDIVECGVWRGGMIAAMAELAGESRKIHLFDSFEGLPQAKAVDGTAAIAWQADTASAGYYDNCSADESFVKQAMCLATHSNYMMYKGWFENTLLSYGQRPISILRLDGDWYDSVMVCLKNLFPYVTERGLVIIDDYHTWDGCSKAVHDYLSEIKSPSRVYQWNNGIAYIIKKN